MLERRNIAFGKPMLSAAEKAAVAQVLAGDTLVHGPKTKEFEKAFAAYTKAPHAISVSSCTAGLHLANFYLGVGPGDEVIVPAQTHVATAHAVELCGGKPVFVDAEEGTGNIDLDLLEGAITSRTKAISVVHFLGMPVDMKRVMEIAGKRDLFVIEDCALAIGAYVDGVHAGLHGDAGCFSFYPVKHMTTIEGGMVITQSGDVARKLGFQRAFGVDRTPNERTIPGVYDVTMLGFNYRMNEVEAAIGIEQLKRMDQFLAARRKNHEILGRHLGEIDGIKLFKSSDQRLRSSYYCLSVVLKGPLAAKRSEALTALKERGVGASVYYPQAVGHFTYYREKYGYRENSFPIARDIAHASIALPVGPHLDESDMLYVAQAMKSVLHSLK